MNHDPGHRQRPTRSRHHDLPGSTRGPRRPVTARFPSCLRRLSVDRDESLSRSTVTASAGPASSANIPFARHEIGRGQATLTAFALASTSAAGTLRKIGANRYAVIPAAKPALPVILWGAMFDRPLAA